jgi:hypothetical protein
MKKNFLSVKKSVVLVAVSLITATAGIRVKADLASDAEFKEMVENDQSDLEVPETYIPAENELATDEEYLSVLKSESEIAGEKPQRSATANARGKHVTLAQPSGDTFQYTDEGGMKPPLKLCTLFMDEHGNLNAYGRIVKNYIQDEIRHDGSSRFLSNDLVGMETNPQICPNWKSFSNDTKIKFWVWMFAATAFEESRCEAKVRDHFDINDYAVGLYQLEKNIKIRGHRGENCIASNYAIHQPYSNIRCAMDMIHYQLLPIETKEIKQSGRLYSAPGQSTNSYFYWLRQPNGGEIGHHLRHFTPCGFGTKRTENTPSFLLPKAGDRNPLMPFLNPPPAPWDPSGSIRR